MRLERRYRPADVSFRINAGQLLKWLDIGDIITGGHIPKALEQLVDRTRYLAAIMINSNKTEICSDLNALFKDIETAAAVACGKIERPQETMVYQELEFVWNGNL